VPRPGYDIEFREFDLRDCSGRQLVEYCRMEFESDSPIYAVFTVGRHSNKVFLAITDGDPIQLSSVLAGVESYDSLNRSVGFGHTMRIENEYLAQNRRPALLFLRPQLLPFLDHFPDCVNIGERHLDFFLVIF
jgi:hypothetical protein